MVSAQFHRLLGGQHLEELDPGILGELAQSGTQIGRLRYRRLIAAVWCANPGVIKVDSRPDWRTVIRPAAYHLSGASVTYVKGPPPEQGSFQVWSSPTGSSFAGVVWALPAGRLLAALASPPGIG